MESNLLAKVVEMFGCDAARISKPLDRLFLIIGYRRHSVGEWMRNGEPFDFHYTEEKCVASGNTEEELLTSAKEYKRLSGLTDELNRLRGALPQTVDCVHLVPGMRVWIVDDPTVAQEVGSVGSGWVRLRESSGHVQYGDQLASTQEAALAAQKGG
jgi:hypothetical protein